MSFLTSLPVKTDYQLLKLVLDDYDTATLKPVAKQHIVAASQAKAINPLQAIAGIVFRLFNINAVTVPGCKQLENFTTSGNQQVVNGIFNSPANINNRLSALCTFARQNTISSQGKLQKNTVADYRTDLLTLNGDDEQVISFSKTSGNNEVTIVYNTSVADAAEKFIRVQTGSRANALTTLYGYDACGQVHLFSSILNDCPVSYIKVYLKPLQVVVLKNY